MTRFVVAGVFCAFSLVAQPPKPGGGSIAGHVLNSFSRAPVRKATVELTQSPAGSYLHLFADTDTAGAFQFTGLPPGTYRLSARRQGFLNRPFRRVISLGSDEHVADAEIGLPPQSVISGRVLDEDGYPEPGTHVWVFKQVFHTGKKAWEPLNTNFAVNDLGEYRVPDLAPGRYLLVAIVTRIQPDNRYSDPAVSSPRALYFPVYYPSVATQHEAQPVNVAPSADVRGIDIRLFKVVRPASVHVKGKVVGFPPDSRVVVNVDLIPADEVPWGGKGSQAYAPDYTFDLTAPPGQYTIRTSVYGGGPEAYGAQSLTLAGDMAGVSLVLRPAPVVTARIVLPESAGPVKIEDVTGVLHSDNHRELRSDANGRFNLPESMKPGHYRLALNTRSVPDGFYIEKVTLGGQEISESDFEIVTSAPLDVVLAKGAARIEGSVVDKDDKPCAVSTVTLIPSDSKVHPEKVSADDSGAFNLTGLRPGKYKLLAWEDVDDDLWQDPDFRKKYDSLATEVTVGSGETQNARVRVVAAEEMK